MFHRFFMGKKPALALVLPALVLGIAAADEQRGFSAKVDIDVNMLEYAAHTESDSELRPYSHNTQTVSGPMRGFNPHDDTTVSVEYNGGSYGGTLGLSVNADPFNVKAGAIKAWVMPFGKWVRLTGGIDIGAGYADSLDADPGMRIYTGATSPRWDASRDPDNITQDKGVLLEGFLGPLTLALAGQYFTPNTLSLDVKGVENEHTRWVNVDQRRYGYGARVGYELGPVGKINVSYIMEYDNIGQNNYSLDRDGNAVPNAASAEVSTHLFGVYASLQPLAGLGVSAGYNGVFTKYLDEFYQASKWNQTLFPNVYQNGVNLNLRYRGIDRLTLRSDHNVSFWADRDYRIFGMPGRSDNDGLAAETLGGAFAEVSHFLLWNGIGAVWQINGPVKAEIYMRNLYREDAAKQAGGAEYRWMRDKFVVEARAVYQINRNAEIYAGVTVENTVTAVSKDVNAQNTSKFKTGVVSRETVDTDFVIKIPMGMTIKLQ
jgi:hypothetical protein